MGSSCPAFPTRFCCHPGDCRWMIWMVSVQVTAVRETCSSAHGECDSEPAAGLIVSGNVGEGIEALLLGYRRASCALNGLHHAPEAEQHCTKRRRYYQSLHEVDLGRSLQASPALSGCRIVFGPSPNKSRRMLSTLPAVPPAPHHADASPPPKESCQLLLVIVPLRIRYYHFSH